LTRNILLFIVVSAVLDHSLFMTLFPDLKPLLPSRCFCFCWYVWYDLEWPPS